MADGYYTNDFYINRKDATTRSAEAVVPYLLELISPQSVVDVGCGTGAWLSVFNKNDISDLIGLDGSYVDQDLLQIEKEKFLETDLEHCRKIDRQFDLVISLEVAEHLHEHSADNFVELLTNLAPVILFSAAIPEQTGEGHINEQWQTYWMDKFEKKGFVAVDCLRGKFWDHPDVSVWYKQNMLLYVRKDLLDKFEPIAQFVACQGVTPISIVHPDYYMSRTQMAFNRPWYCVYFYYREWIVERVKKILPTEHIVFLKKIRNKLAM